MIAKHTLTHAIQYLEQAERIKSDSHSIISDWRAMEYVDPGKPCAAFGLAKRRLKRCWSLNAAIADLKKQLEAV
ncbi:MAG TPA: hypothetical protein VN629_06920 [Castellaniella sp.]|nr:hypothetical protein [Castellaniella sp.]